MIELDASKMDEREGLPSISYFDQLANCPGAFHAQRDLPEDEDDTGIRQQGTDLHAVMAGELPESVIPTSLHWVIDRTCELEQSLLDSIFPEYQRDDLIQISEDRYWFTDNAGNKVYSGRLDRVWFTPDYARAAVIDYKFGFKRVQNAKSNRQIRGAAVLLARRYAVQEVYGAIIQPRISGEESLLIAKFGPDQLRSGSEKNLRLVARALDEYAERVPGLPQCLYCKAKPTCGPAIEYFENTTSKLLGSLELPVIYPAGTKPKDRKKSVELAVKSVPVETRKFVLDTWPTLKAIGESLYNSTKAGIEAGEEVPGYIVTQGKEQREVTDPAKFIALIEEGMGRKLTNEEAAEILKPTVTKAQDIFCKATKKTVMDFNLTVEQAIGYKSIRGSIQSVS